MKKRGRSTVTNHKASSKRLRHRSSCNMYYIPLELKVEILKKLPTKSLVRFQSVSKQWSSIIGTSRDFIDSIITRSSSHPCDTHLIFHYQSLPTSSCFIFSSIQPQDHTSQEPISSIHGLTVENYVYVRGLILCWSETSLSAAIYNPTTRQSLLLPKIQLSIDDSIKKYFFVFGYDPMKNKYKVLCLVTTSEESENTCFVLTLGDPKKQWRSIQCNMEHHYPWLPSVCIDGVIYYRATKDHGSTFFLASFDVRFEKFNLVKAPSNLIYSTLINYQGKLGFVKGMEILVMEDAEKQEWSKIVGSSPTGSGEIVYVKMLVCRDMVLAVYSDPKLRHGIRLVRINGTSEEERKRNDLIHILGVPYHVENTMRL